MADNTCIWNTQNNNPAQKLEMMYRDGYSGLDIYIIMKRWLEINAKVPEVLEKK